jgi:glycosyltransferase involved in cell wall biosynthesis
MKVSVVIPTYNHGRYVLQTLKSVFAQTFRDREIIVVNDGSPDDTAARLEPLVKDGRIRYVEQANMGQGAARNRGLQESRGEYIAFLDDDDLWPPDKLAWQVQFLDAQPDTVLVYGDHVRLDENGLSSHEPSHAPSGRVYSAFRHRNWIHSPGQTLIRARALHAVGGFDARIWGSDDWEMYLRLSRRGAFQHVPWVALHYRVHDANASHHATRHAQNHLAVVRRHIGWNLPLLIRHQREAARYFVWRLLGQARELEADGAMQCARRAYLYALAFQPTLLCRRSFLSRFAASLRG